MLDEINDHGFQDIITTRKVNAIQAAVWEIESMEPWPFLEETITLTFSGSSGLPSNVPSNFRAALRLKDLQTGRRISWVRLDEYEDMIGLQADLVGNPTVFYLDGGQVHVWPIPPASTTVRMRYLRWSTAITSTSVESDFLIPPQFHDAIVKGALQRIYDMEDDPGQADRMRGLMNEEVARMKATLFANEFDRPDFISVDPEDWQYT